MKEGNNLLTHCSVCHKEPVDSCNCLEVKLWVSLNKYPANVIKMWSEYFQMTLDNESKICNSCHKNILYFEA